MDFELTEEQQIVRDTAREFAEKTIKPRAADIDKNHEFPADIVKQLGEMGFMGVAFPEEYGGAEMDNVTYVLVLEEVSRACASCGVIVSVNNSLACDPVYIFGTDGQKERFLKPMASGEKLGALTMTEPGAGSDPGSIKTTMEDKGDHWLVNGTKNFCTNGAEADILIFLGVTDKEKGNKGQTTLIVEKDTPGFSIGKLEDKLGICGSSTAELVFEDCRIPKENTLGEVNGGFKVCMVTLDGGRIGIASQALGIAKASLDEAIAYSKERIQFGKPIAANQAIQWMIADMTTEYEAARLLTLYAAWMKDKGMRFTREAAMAKLKASEVASFCADKALQIHGGYGYTKDYAAERHYRDARITEIYEGTSEIMRMVVSGWMLK
jgi:butyryl-CoA dehydrogenase